MAKNPLVSVIMPAYNHERYVGEAIESVLNQTFTDFEFIIINDGSTDSTDEIIRRYKDSRIRYYTQENMDAPNTINRGIELSNGKYISIINSDDIYHHDRLAVLVDTAESKDARFIATDLVFIDESSKVIEDPLFKYNYWYNRLKSIYKETGSIKSVIFSNNIVVTSSNMFFHSNAKEEIGLFNKYRYTHDYDFILRALAVYRNRFLFLADKTLLYYRIHDKNTIRQAPLRSRNETFDIFIRMIPEFMSNGDDRLVLEKALFRLGKLYDNQLRESRRLRKSNRKMRRSRSWKLTAPLRWFYRKYSAFLRLGSKLSASK